MLLGEYWGEKEQSKRWWRRQRQLNMEMTVSCYLGGHGDGPEYFYAYHIMNHKFIMCLNFKNFKVIEIMSKIHIQSKKHKYSPFS